MIHFYMLTELFASCLQTTTLVDENALNRNQYDHMVHAAQIHMSWDTRFPTMWFVLPAYAQSDQSLYCRAYFHHFGTMTHSPGIGNFRA